jgi:hypothetical protein
LTGTEGIAGRAQSSLLELAFDFWQHAANFLPDFGLAGVGVSHPSKRARPTPSLYRILDSLLSASLQGFQLIAKQPLVDSCLRQLAGSSKCPLKRLLRQRIAAELRLSQLLSRKRAPTAELLAKPH